MTRSPFPFACFSAALLVTAPGVAAAQAEPPATGFAFWVRAAGGTAQDIVSSAVGGPRFAVGFRRDRLTLGLGLGVSRVRSLEETQFDPQTSSEDETTADAFQLGPSALFEIWRSADGLARGQIAAGVTVGRGSVTERNVFRDPGGTFSSRTKTSGTLVGIHIALGGEHFLHPHFALGLEGGFQATFASDVEEEVTGGGTGSTFSLGASGAYGALRAMVVF